MCPENSSVKSSEKFATEPTVRPNGSPSPSTAHRHRQSRGLHQWPELLSGRLRPAQAGRVAGRYIDLGGLGECIGEQAHEQTAADALVNRRRTRRRHSAREPNERSLAQNANNKPAADMTPLSNQSRHSLQNWYGNPNLQTKCIGQIYCS